MDGCELVCKEANIRITELTHNHHPFSFYSWIQIEELLCLEYNNHIICDGRLQINNLILIAEQLKNYQSDAPPTLLVPQMDSSSLLQLDPCERQRASKSQFY